MNDDFRFVWRVRFNEIDMQRVVHHPQIVIYFETARVEFWRHHGFSYKKMRENGFDFIVKNVNVEYIKPLYFDEVISIKVTVKTLARASFVLRYEIQKENNELAVVGETQLVCSKVGVSKPTALPSEFLEKMRNSLE